ncbi:protein kinase [Achlya hypogyna]|uniref:Protein kinase n=1 Tax=Achlya hypogyna TaxID=1202772 RepID=A0A1V9Z7S2_ACHHY|nr:protein kinase [Achlya hypogyna]
MTKAIKLGLDDVVAVLLDAEADLRATNAAGDAPLVCAIKVGRRDMARRIYQRLYEAVNDIDDADAVVITSQQLGSGSYGAVYLGSYDGQPVAVKVAALNATSADTIRAEIRLMREHASPYIVPLLGEIRGVEPPKMVLEYMDMGNLGKYLAAKRDGLAVTTDYSTLEVAWVIAHALWDLHSRGVMHRDLKSHNILLCSKNYIKLADLGISKEVQTRMTTEQGTCGWIAPEVYESGYSYSYPADIYSFGVILIELDTLQLPFSGLQLNQYQIRFRISNGTLTPQPRVDCDPWLRDLICACVHRDPARRPTAKEIVATLAEHMDGVVLETTDEIAVLPRAPTTAPTALSTAGWRLAMNRLARTHYVWTVGLPAAAADVYSFGVVLTELDTLEMPYTNPPLDAFRIRHGICNGTLHPRISDRCAPWWRELILACLAHDPAMRPTAEVIVATLAPHMAEEMATRTADAVDAAYSDHSDAATEEMPGRLSPSTTSAPTKASTPREPSGCVGCRDPAAMLMDACGTCGLPLPDVDARVQLLVEQLTAVGNAKFRPTLTCDACDAHNEAMATTCHECAMALSPADEKLSVLVQRWRRAQNVAAKAAIA